MSERMTFIEHFIPPLEAGTYQVSVEQRLKHAPTADVPEAIDEAYVNTRRFVVSGPRFRLDPTEVNAVFPPANNQGEHGNVLPHVVLTRRTLPWERTPDGTGDGRPWLALLLFDEHDPPPPVSTVQLGDLQRQPFVREPAATATASTLAADAVSYEDGFRILKLTFAREYGEEWSDRCQVIDVPADLFRTVAPSLDDLSWLAHARTVSTVRKAGVAGEAPATFSVVVGNRLTGPGSRCTVHLVSLEGMAPFLPGGAAGQAKTIRLVSLRSWSYTSLDPRESFTGYLKALNTGPLQRALQAPDPGQQVAGAFAMGYTAAAHHTRQGDRTVSWYRGPLVPFEVPSTIFVPTPDPDSGLPVRAIETADELVRYEPANGLMDVTYAAAWQLGRLLALQNQRFAAVLQDWRRDNTRRTAASLLHAVGRERFGAALALPADLADGPAVLGAAAQFIATHLKPPAVRASTGAALAPAASANAASRATLTARRAHFERLHALATQPAALAGIHATATIPDEIGAWLGRLRRLYGVPFNYLVPDEGALPAESIRFFQVDPNWIYSLIEGATSVGRSSSSEAAHDAVFTTRLHGASTAAARLDRGVAPPSGPDPVPVTGFLLRSEVVAGWPGLEVDVFDAADTRLQPLRFDHLSATVLLVLVEGIVDHVHIHEPPEGLHFGIDVSPAYEKGLRYVTVPADAPHARPGDPIVGAPVPVEDRGARALAIGGLATRMEKALAAAHANTNPDGTARPFRAAEFALQMVEGVQSVTFIRRPSGSAP
jgi:hypothetical protein